MEPSVRVPITYLTGDATVPTGDGPKVIAHVCNTSGAWGRGFVMSVSARWPEPEALYRQWHAAKRRHVGLANPTKGWTVLTSGDFKLGSVQTVQVAPDLYISNMVAQSGLRGPGNPRPVRYEALEMCLRGVNMAASMFGASVHVPRIGCGLGGGRWEDVEPILRATMSGRRVYVYDQP